MPGVKRLMSLAQRSFCPTWEGVAEVYEASGHFPQHKHHHISWTSKPSTEICGWKASATKPRILVALLLGHWAKATSANPSAENSLERIHGMLRKRDFAASQMVRKRLFVFRTENMFQTFRQTSRPWDLATQVWLL